MASVTGACLKGGAGVNSTKTRAGLMGIVAGYLLYLAWQLFEGRNDPDTTMTPAAAVLFIAFFVIAAVAVGAYALRLWKRGKKEDEEKQDEDGVKQ